ncbi:MAG: PIN domain-containing protein [Ferruginibacter sp.]|nr:PIN domain-containing protein [Cytophagales bacterium]
MPGDRSFLDTNVLVYAYSADDLVKQAQALAVCQLDDAVISTQVVQELINTFRRKFSLDWSALERLRAELVSNYPIHINTLTTIQIALRLANRYQFSWFDAILVAAALETEATLLYSEDLQDGQVIDGLLTIRNPFV